MKKVENYKKISMLLAIGLLFSTVQPVSVFAEDSSFIMNVVTSSHSTGGQSSHGQDGQDGKKGEDGMSGVSGADVINIDNDTVTSAKLQANDTHVLDIEKTQTSSDVVAQEAISEASSSTLAVASVTEVNEEGSPKSTWNAIRKTFLLLPLMLVKYVSVLL